MPCPSCDGHDREPIAPGFWRCTSLRAITREIGGPGLTDPRLGPGVLYVRDEVVCGVEYQENGSGLSCACQTFAIGRCAECGDPVCGIHSEVLGGVRLCLAHLAVERAKLDHARIDDQRRKNDERETAWRAWEDGVAHEFADSPLVERIIRFLRVLTIDELMHGVTQPLPRSPALGDALRELLPDLWSGDLVTTPPWDHGEVHAWIAATIPPQATNILYLNERGIFARAVLGRTPQEWERAPAQGWVVNDAPPKPGNTAIAAFTDGRRGTIDGNGQCSFSDSAPGFNVYAMWNLGELARLPDLPDPPESESRYASLRLWGT